MGCSRAVPEEQLYVPECKVGVQAANLGCDATTRYVQHELRR